MSARLCARAAGGGARGGREARGQALGAPQLQDRDGHPHGPVRRPAPPPAPLSGAPTPPSAARLLVSPVPPQRARANLACRPAGAARLLVRRPWTRGSPRSPLLYARRAAGAAGARQHACRPARGGTRCLPCDLPPTHDLEQQIPVYQSRVGARGRLWHVEADVKHRDAQLAELQRQLDEQKRLRELEAHHHYGAGAGGAHAGEHDWTPGIHHGDDPAHWTGARARQALGLRGAPPAPPAAWVPPEGASTAESSARIKRSSSDSLHIFHATLQLSVASAGACRPCSALGQCQVRTHCGSSACATDRRELAITRRALGRRPCTASPRRRADLMGALKGMHTLAGMAKALVARLRRSAACKPKASNGFLV